MEKNFKKGDAFNIAALELIEHGYTISKSTDLNSNGDIYIHDIGKLVHVYGSYTDSPTFKNSYDQDLRRNLSKGSKIYDYYIFVRATDDIRFFVLTAAEMWDLQIIKANKGTVNGNKDSLHGMDRPQPNAVKFEDLFPFENKWESLK